MARQDNRESQMCDEQDDAVEVIYRWCLLPSGELRFEPPGPMWVPVLVERDKDMILVTCAGHQVAGFLEGKI